MKKIFILSVFIFILFVANAYAQSAGGPKVTMTVISAGSHSFGPASPDPSKVKVEEEVRDPTAKDLIEGIKSKAQVAITIPQANETTRWAHSLRVRAVNLTVYNGTNEENETVYYNDLRVYDPTTGKNYTTQLAYIANQPGKAYINWNGWVPIRDLIMVKVNFPIKPGRGLFNLKQQPNYGFLPIARFQELLFPKFH